MSRKSNSEYYAKRALQERQSMAVAHDPRAIVAHAELAARYEALASDPSLELPITPTTATPPRDQDAPAAPSLADDESGSRTASG